MTSKITVKCSNSACKKIITVPPLFFPYLSGSDLYLAPIYLSKAGREQNHLAFNFLI